MRNRYALPIHPINENLVEVRWASGREEARLTVAHQMHRIVERVQHIAGSTFRVMLQPVDPPE